MSRDDPVRLVDEAAACVLSRGRLWAIRLPAAPGMVALTGNLPGGWTVVRLGAVIPDDPSGFSRLFERAAADLARIPEVDRLTRTVVATPPTGPRSLFLHLTAGCNLRCRHCYLGPERLDASDRFATHRLVSLLPELARRGIRSLTLSGGEPLLLPDLGTILCRCAEAGIGVQLLTNATLIDRASATMIADGGATVLASLHGPDAPTHDRISGAGSFEPARDGISRLADRLPPDRLTINCVMTDSTLPSLPEMVVTARRLGAGRIRFMPLHDRTGPVPGAPDLDPGSPAVLAWAEAAAAIVTGGAGIEVSAGFTGLPGGTRSDCGGRDCFSACHLGRSLVAATDGRLYPCVLLMGTTDQVGRIDEQNGIEVAGQALDTVTRAARGRPERISRCGECALAPICQAGCPALAREYSGGFDRPDPFCRAIRSYSVRYFEGVARRAAAQGAGRVGSPSRT